MGPGEICLLIVFLLASGLMVGLGIPLSMGLVRPNPVYGFRTKETLEDPNVWYPTNRVAGLWGIATGVAEAAVSIWAFFAGLPLPTGPLVTLATVLVGIVATLLHGMLVIRRLTRGSQKTGTD
jgi:SdpI/YfhL protein family